MDILPTSDSKTVAAWSDSPGPGTVVRLCTRWPLLCNLQLLMAFLCRQDPLRRLCCVPLPFAIRTALLGGKGGRRSTSETEG